MDYDGQWHWFEKSQELAMNIKCGFMVVREKEWHFLIGNITEV
jgi:hypothetical protein